MALFNHLLLTLQSCIFSSFLNISITHQSTHPPKKSCHDKKKRGLVEEKQTRVLGFLEYNLVNYLLWCSHATSAFNGETNL